MISSEPINFSAPVVTVRMITYNHGRYVAQAIESALMQETNFPWELLIVDDCSSDNTPEICKDYARRYPDRIRLELNDRNLGMMPNSIKATGMCRGKYVAWLEGDDYWLTTDKLQKQVDVMQANTDVTLCYHANLDVNEAGEPLPPHLPPRRPRDKLEIFERGDFVRGTFGDLTTASVLFVRSILEPMPLWYAGLPIGDISLYALASLRGRVAAIPGVHSAYRRHAGGIVGACHAEHREQEHVTKWLWWLNHICQLYKILLSEADDGMKELCRKRCYDQNMEVVWYARVLGRISEMRAHLRAAAACSPRRAALSSAFWKLCLLSVFPVLDGKRAVYLEEYRKKRDLELKGTS